MMSLDSDIARINSEGSNGKEDCCFRRGIY
jgi:hypothetical protein